MRSFVLAIVLVLIGSTAFAVSYTVKVHDRPVDLINAILRVRNLDGGGQTLRKEITLPGSGGFDLPAGRWELSIEAKGYWAAPQYTGGEPVVIDTWPTGLIAGSITREENDKPNPLTLRLHFERAPDSSETGVLAGAVDCSVDEAVFRCEVPVGVYDLVMGVTGFAPHRFWDVGVNRSEPATVGSLRLVRGASATGRVVLGRRAAVALDKIVIRLEPKGAHGSSYSMKPTRRGHFSYAGLPPGDYFVYAEAPGLSSDVREMRLLPGLEANLRGSLVVSAPRKIEVTVMPGLDIDGKPWGVRLLRSRLGEHDHYDVVTESNTSSVGLWSHSPVRDGNYKIEINSQSGSNWSVKEFVVDGGDVREVILAASGLVRGRVTLGGDPLQCQVTLGGESRPESRTLVADEHGTFSGLAPSPEKTEWRVLIESQAPHVKRNVTVKGERRADGSLFLDLNLPRTIVMGTVTNENGEPEKWPIIKIQTDDLNVHEQVSGYEDGSFDLVGLDAGKYRIAAEGFLTRSDVVENQISDKDAEPLKLITHSDVQLKGRIVSGPFPVGGAVLYALPQGMDVSSLPMARATELGAFNLVLPSRSLTIDLLVGAAGMALTMERIPVKPDKSLLVMLDPRPGSLELEVPNTRRVMLAHAGAMFGLRFAVDVGQGGIILHGRRETAVLPFVEPGEYSVCAENRCVSGFVTPYGVLKLSLF